MSVLEPKTRKEVYLNAIAENDTAGLPTPKTREELYLDAIARNDKSNIPSKPLTRTEKYLEAIVENGGGDVTIEALSVDENGTYTAPSGTAYTPVTVEVPQTVLDTLNVTENGTYTAEEGHAFDEVNVSVSLPQDAYLIKSASGTIATFTDGQDLVMPKCEAEINAVQSGSGDPSPSNIRPISGFDGVNITNQSDLQDETTKHVTSVSWQTEAGTVYGGKVDLVSGVLTVTHKAFEVDNESDIEKLSTMVWRINKSKYPDGVFEGDTINGLLCEKFKPQISDMALDLCYETKNGLVIRTVNEYTNALDFFTQIGSFKFTYELATPITYQLNPTAIKSLLGKNNVFSDTNGDVSLQYFSKEG